MYKPLPDSLTIKTSKVNGLGLFAKEAIPQATNLGMTHVKIGEKIIRTPLGGFINHANDSNCIKVELYIRFIIFRVLVAGEVAKKKGTHKGCPMCCRGGS